MNSIANAKYKEPSANYVGRQYNFQHIVLVTKYRYKMFKNPKIVEIIPNIFYNTVERHRTTIKGMPFHMTIRMSTYKSLYQIRYKFHMQHVVEMILFIQNAQKCPYTHCYILKNILGLQGTVMEVSAQDMKIYYSTK